MKILGLRKRFYLPPLICLSILYIIAAISSNMDVKHVYNICPVFIVYTNNILKENQIATCKNIFVFIRPEFKNDKRVLKHELVHAKQSYRYCLHAWLIVLLSDDYLARFESEAYASEINNKLEIPLYADLIHTEYTPSIPVDVIEGYIEYYWQKNM